MKHMLARDEQGKNSGRWLAEVRDYLHISKAAVSQMLSSLEKKGLITREPDPENRRTIIVNLTDEGRAAIDAIEHRFDKHIRAVIERVGEDDTREIIRLIYKFVEAMRDVRMNEDAACGAEENE